MNFPFRLRDVLLSSDEVITLNGATMSAEQGRDPKLRMLLEDIGSRSATAQGLPVPVTSLPKLVSGHHRIYLAVFHPSTVLGFIKVGEKHLSVYDRVARIRQFTALCVLDFYVHESCQRQGVGRLLFEHMCLAERTDPADICYDRPSEKFTPFLARHYRLRQYVPQVTNMVVFDDKWVPPERRQCVSLLNPSAPAPAPAPEPAPATLAEEQPVHEEPERDRPAAVPSEPTASVESVKIPPATKHAAHVENRRPALKPQPPAGSSQESVDAFMEMQRRLNHDSVSLMRRLNQFSSLSTPGLGRTYIPPGGK